MKHAYLIIAHNNWVHLQTLLNELDDARNDIYLHIDRKVKSFPTFTTEKAGLFVLSERIDVRWGHVSQIECEYRLFEAVLPHLTEYNRIHLISGTHFPLKSQNYLHQFFGERQRKEVLRFMGTRDLGAGRYKIGFRHFFVSGFHLSSPRDKVSNLLWRIALRVQIMTNFSRSLDFIGQKVSNWISITPEALAYFVREKERTLKRFRYTYCGDEWFVSYLFEQQTDKFQIENYQPLLYFDFAGGEYPRSMTDTDFDFLMRSDYLFARKFTDKEAGLVHRISDFIKSQT